MLRLPPSGVDVRDHDTCTLVGEGTRDCGADTGSRSGDNSDLVLQKIRQEYLRFLLAWTVRAWAPPHPKTQLVIDPVRRVRRLAVVAQRAAMG